MIVSTASDQLNGTKVWVERQVLFEDPSDDEEDWEGSEEGSEEKGDANNIVFLGIKQKNSRDSPKADREVKKIK